MRLTFKYPVYPTKTQEITLFQWLDHLCKLQNSARHDRKVAWETAGERVSLKDQKNKLTVARKKYADFREVPQDVQACALERTDKAFDGFYRRCEKGAAKKGYPRHRKRIKSMTWKLRKYSVKNKSTGEYESVRQNPIRETAWKHDRLKVPGLGEVKIYMHRPLRGDPKEVSLVKKASNWYAHISCELPDTPKVEPTDAIAVDVGTTDYLTTSEGEKEENPRWYRQAEGLLQKHAKDLSRKTLGSHRRKKQQHKLALHHERTANRRKDFIGKLVYKLYHHKDNNVLVAENLNTSNMVQNKHLSKSISDASWGIFFKWCADMVSERDGLHFHQVDPKNTSQTCSSCGQKSPKKLSLAIRTFSCQSCGTSLDRDHNAALNILFKAAAAFRGERWVATLYETRNKNEATKTKGLETAEQLLLFNALNTGFRSL